MLARPLLVLLLCTLAHAQAQSPLVLDGTETSVALSPHFTVLRDADGRLDFDAVSRRASEFVPLAPGGEANFGYVDGAVWLRVQLRSAAVRRSDWRLQLDYASLDHADLFERLPDGSVRQLRTGDRLPFSQRAVRHRNPVFPLELAPDESRTLYLRVQSEGSLTLSSALWRADAFAVHSERGYSAQALYLGMLLALAIYNALLYVALRDRVYLLYVLFAVGLGVCIASIFGLAGQFLWPDWIELSNRALPVGAGITAVVGPLFARELLDARRAAPTWHRVLGIAALLHVGTLALTLFGPLRLGMQASSLAIFVNCLLMLAFGIDGIRRRLPGARLFVIAWLMMLFGGLLMALRNFGLVATNALTLHSIQVGSALEMLLLSFALAARFNQLKREKEDAQARALAAQDRTVQAMREHELELEHKVAERTEELAAVNVQLRELALRDPLTALANRAALYAHLDHALQRAARHGQPLALLMIDLDGFKPVNDRLGHEAGDRVLLEVADRLRRAARASDVVARLGGDEFVIVCEDTDPARAACFAERALSALLQPIVIAGERVGVGASIGIAAIAGEAVDSSDLLRRADQAMYAAKAAGRGTIRVADPQSAARASMPVGDR